MPVGRGQMSGGGIPVCHKMIRGRCSEVHCLRCPDSDVSRGSKCPDIIIIRDVNSREIAFLGWEMQFPGLDRDSRFRPSTFTGDGVIGLGSPVGVQRGEGEGWSGADRRSPLPLPRAPPAIWLRSLWSPMPGPMARNVAKRLEERTREAQWPISPQKTGRVIAPHPVGCRWTIDWRHGRSVGHKPARGGSKARHRTQDCLTGRLVYKISNYLQGSLRLSQCWVHKTVSACV